MWDMTHSYVEHDPSMCVTWLIHMWFLSRTAGITCSTRTQRDHVWHDSSICVTCLFLMCDLTLIHDCDISAMAGMTWKMFNKHPTWLWLAPNGKMVQKYRALLRNFRALKMQGSFFWLFVSGIVGGFCGSVGLCCRAHCGNVGLFCANVGLFCANVGLCCRVLCGNAGLFCQNIGLFCWALCGNILVFRGNVGLFL